MRATRTLVWVCGVMGVVAGAAFGQTFSQNFESDAVGSTAGWNGGQRWFDPTPGAVAAVTGADSVSPSNSLSVTDPNGTGFFLWRSYGGLSSDGVQDITVSFDMKVNNYGDNIAVSPFAYNPSVWGGNSGSSGGFGWPVNTNLTIDNTFSYYDENAGSITMLDAAVVGDLRGQWIHWSGTVHPAARTADVTVTLLTGPSAGATGGVTGANFQYGVASDYYGDAMDALCGLVIFNPASASFGGELLIDNLRVVVPEPASLILLGLGGLAVVSRRRSR